MIDITVRDLKKAYDDGKDILDGLGFAVQAGEHIGILGKNGCGKTTLFRLLSGELSPDEGEVSVGHGKRLGLISQIPKYPREYTVEDVLKTAHSRVYELRADMERLEAQMNAQSSGDILSRYDKLSAEFIALGGYDIDFERDRVANGLDIPQDMRGRLFSKLSGGERTRVNLARLILEDTDILLLDEPTNHLDLKATEWLEEYIQKFKGTVLSISHDRWFLDKTAHRCIEIVAGKAEFYSGNYSFYIEEKERRFEERMRQFEKNQTKIDQLQKAADDMHLWAFMGNDKLHKRAFSMEKRIERLKTVDKPQVDKKIKAAFTSREFSGDEVLLAEGLSKTFGEKKLFEDLDLLIEGQERIALIGDNGAGKSTLIKIIMGEDAPDAGYLRKGPSVKIAYLPQIIHFPHPERGLLDTMIYDENCTHQSARDRLAAFGFRGEDVFKSVGTLSGGEQSRLRLCMLMRKGINLLILDEPTNHLDIASREWIEDAVSDYGQALLFVSHDRWFIEKFATRVWDLRNGTITDYRGTFSQYREYMARQEAFRQASAKPEKKEKSAGPKKPNAREDAKRLTKLEREIAKLEDELSDLVVQEVEFSSDYKKLLELVPKKQELEGRLEELYLEWEELA